MKSEIYFIPTQKDKVFEEPNGLKKFLNIIKFFNKKEPFKFAFSNGNGSLHHTISVRQNLDLEAIPTSISLNNKLKTKEIIDNIENEYLQKLIGRICPLERLPVNLNKEELKLASIIKGVISQTDYLFLDSPDNGLSESNLTLVKNCILYEAKVKKKTIIITSANDQHWLEICDKVITTNNNSYKLEVNTLLYTPEQIKVPHLKIA